MERLTERLHDDLKGVYVKDHDYVVAAHRLADYEDTGLTPERFRELAQAEEQGRLVVLPVYDEGYIVSVSCRGCDYTKNWPYDSEEWDESPCANCARHQYQDHSDRYMSEAALLEMDG